jgi:hypothetical protein
MNWLFKQVYKNHMGRDIDFNVEPTPEDLLEIINIHGLNTSESGIYWDDEPPEALLKDLDTFIRLVKNTHYKRVMYEVMRRRRKNEKNQSL